MSLYDSQNKQLLFYKQHKAVYLCNKQAVYFSFWGGGAETGLLNVL
jgi:hypothetical protein